MIIAACIRKSKETKRSDRFLSCLQGYDYNTSVAFNVSYSLVYVFVFSPFL